MGRQELVPIIEPLARRAEYSGDALLVLQVAVDAARDRARGRI